MGTPACLAVGAAGPAANPIRMGDGRGWEALAATRHVPTPPTTFLRPTVQQAGGASLGSQGRQPLRAVTVRSPSPSRPCSVLRRQGPHSMYLLFFIARWLSSTKPPPPPPIWLCMPDLLVHTKEK